jgi:hypothetical protein
MQIFPTNEQSFADAHLCSILEHKKIIGLGNWEGGEKDISDFRHKMNVNDVVAIKIGQKLIALVQVIGGWYEVKGDTSETDWIENRRPIRVLDWELNGKTLPHSRGTLTPCVDNNVETTKIIKDWHSRVVESFTKRKLDLFV